MHASLTFWNTDCSPKGTVLAWLCAPATAEMTLFAKATSRFTRPTLDLIRQLSSRGPNAATLRSCPPRLR